MEYASPSPVWATKSDVDEFAEQVGTWLELEVGAPLETVVASLGGTIAYGGLDDHESDGGAIVARSNNDFTIFLPELTTSIRDRFTIAHELGHLFLHLPAILENDTNAVMRATRLIDNTNENQMRAEWEANWFAAGLLMPAAAMRKYKDKGAEFISARFNVSIQAATIRLKSFR